jgi:hypothetical protein
MLAFKLSEISVVDRLAQEGARIVLTKRADDEPSLPEEHLKETAPQPVAESKPNSNAQVQEEPMTQIATTAPADNSEINKRLAEAEALAKKSEADKVELLKRLEANEKDLAEVKKDNADKAAEIRKADLIARADIFKSMPGTKEAHGVLLGAIEAIPDEEMRKQCIASVKAGAASLASAFATIGSVGKSAQASGTEAYQAALAKYASEQGMSKGAAMQRFNETTDGAALYKAATAAE